ncbi:hypothetical protein CICLE_v10020463mg [Citrus x clementina]|uniref:G domain-containing protein n=4 Tax=Citrus TaxID=2706 RepID=A0ACB8MHT0_CITSI|nr:uncharacterized protein LOC18046429 isoform X1 [Citrus x clementina]ESR56780.1 hypothetical protein CICLE_v10020463mg [Citrus x clementina]KAH9784750.1 G domain-containing protein [Citrus sinensis]
MGGEKTTSRFFTPEGEEIISPVGDFDFPLLSMNSGDDEGSQDSWDSLVDQRRRDAVFREVLQSYDQLRTRIGSLTDAKNKILSYTPGAWIENVGGMTLSDYDVPKTTSLLLIGPKGSGKSSLVNRISKVFENDKFASERAQVTYNSSVGDGTYFLQEYTIPRGSNSFSLYDTRSLSDDASDNINMIKLWIMEGVRHGELVIRRSDSSSLRNRMRCKARKIGCDPSVIRKVNFVIFVVDGLAVLKSMEGDSDVEKQYDQIVATTFNCPYLSFRDDKPVVVVTHGDLLSLTDRARIRTYLGELLGIPPAKQIFDIPESSDPENELIIIDMLRYCLEHADRNLSCKSCARNKGFRVSVMAFLNLLLVLGIAIIAFKMQHLNAHRIPKSNSHVDWRAIRHLWLD